MPFGVNFVRSQVLYRAAQGAAESPFCSASIATPARGQSFDEHETPSTHILQDCVHGCHAAQLITCQHMSLQLLLEGRLPRAQPGFGFMAFTYGDHLQVMLERIAALEAMLQQAPIVSGRFTPAPYLYLAKPLHQDMSAAVAAASQLGR